MADPRIVELVADEWVKVATAVKFGSLTILSRSPNDYLHDNRDTGGAKPTDRSTAKHFNKTGEEPINNSVRIDVYVFSIGGVGKLIVDV